MNRAFRQTNKFGKPQLEEYTHPIEEFRAANTGFDIRIGSNHFNTSGMTLDISDPDRTLQGEIRFRDPEPSSWPVTPLSPGIMGWYACASVAVRLSQRSVQKSLILFEGEGRNAGLEDAGDLDQLRQMLFHGKTSSNE